MNKMKTTLVLCCFILSSLEARAVDLRYRAAVELNFSPAFLPIVGDARGLGVGGELHLLGNFFVIADYSYSYYFSRTDDRAQKNSPDPYSYRDDSAALGIRLYSHFSPDSAYLDLGVSRRDLTAATEYKGSDFDSSSVDQNFILGAGLRFIWDSGAFVRLGGETHYRFGRSMTHKATDSEAKYSLTEQTFSSIELKEQRHQFLLRSTLGFAF